MSVEVARLDAPDWRRLRELRIASLRDAPYAFSASPEEAAVAPEAEWQERLSGQAWFCASRDGRDVGLVCGVVPRDGDGSARMVRAMWVEPGERGRGTAAGLLDALAAWARAEGATKLVLWALSTAPRARAFYASYGFDEVPDAPSPHPELEMTRYELTL